MSNRVELLSLMNAVILYFFLNVRNLNEITSLDAAVKDSIMGGGGLLCELHNFKTCYMFFNIAITFSDRLSTIRPTTLNCIV